MLVGMRRSIDDHPATEADLPPDWEELDITRVSWAVAISDDYEDAEPRVVLTVEEVGAAGTGLVAHLTPTVARRLRLALRDALKEVGEAPGD
jgi:hypothetical protein